MSKSNRATASMRARAEEAEAAVIARKPKPAAIEMPVDLAKLLMLRLDAARTFVARLPAMYAAAELVAIDPERNDAATFFGDFFDRRNRLDDMQAAIDHMRHLSADIERIAALVQASRAS